MATSSSARNASTSTSLGTTSGRQPDLEQRRKDAAQEWIDAASYIPKNIGFDWRPLCEALVDNHRNAEGDFVMPPRPVSPEDPGDNRTDVIRGPDPARLAPALGESWEHVRYIPAWMDPDYREEFIDTPDNQVVQNTVTTRDSIYNLRPALRLSDGIRNPTEYALRYGIAAGRLDGRSRMSPTWSKTRNPVDDFNNQVNQLSDTERQVAVELSRQRYQQLGRTPVPGQEILPEVMELLLAQHGLLTNAELVAEVERAARTGMSLDQMVNELETRNPRIKEAHRVFLDNAQDDQDYQRILLGGLTTDEMIQHNIHTMADDAVMELDNPIHPMFTRNYWDDCEWKGRTPRWPRNVYNVDGIRAEWNVFKNDALWNALGPALRLASMVLSKEPPILEAVMDMNTRQPLPVEQDGRVTEDDDTPTLAKYVLREDIEMDKTYPALRTLKEVHNYDWKDNILTVLQGCLMLDIDWGFSLGEGGDRQPDDLTADSHRRYSYGSTWYDAKRGVIRLRIAAELIWPLLVPQYSASERMVASFTIATVLLHEFAHAANIAAEVLMTRNYKTDDQTPEITDLLVKLGKDLLNKDSVEPFFEESPQAELGRDFEFSLWGCSSNLTGLQLNYPRHLRAHPLTVGIETHPSQPGTFRLDAPGPVVRYIKPVSLEYIAKFFRKSFWAEEFEAYGFPALKMRPGDAPHMVLVYTPRHTTTRMDRSTYGPDLAAFLQGVSGILYTSRQKVLAEYLEALKLETVYQVQWANWWAQEIRNWEEELLHPLETSVELLLDTVEESKTLNEQQLANDQAAYYTQWCYAQTGGGPLKSFEQWKKDTEDAWRDMFRYGGEFMQSLLAVHNDMHDDLGTLERMVFHYLSIKPVHVDFQLTNEASAQSTVGRIYERLTTYFREAQAIAGLAGRLSTLPHLADNRDKWSQWQARFESNARQYDELLSVFIKGSTPAGGEFDIRRKAWFNRLPSGDFKRVSERWKKLAFRDYTRAPPAVREVIDTYLSLFKKVNPNLINAQAVNGIDQIESAIQSLGGIDRKPKRQTRSIFDFAIPPAQPPVQPQTGPQSVPVTWPPQVAPPITSAIFGIPGRKSSLGGSPPRRITAAGGVQKATSTAQQRSAFRSYVTNLLGTPDRTMASKAADDLFRSGVPQSLVNLLPGKPLAAVGKRRGIAPFPNPYASRVVMTSDDIEFQEQQELDRKAAQATGKAAGVYVSPSLWREKMRKSDSDDEDDDMS
ncbi:hypothetical protein F5Y10DRAFT_284198 [Nemania abortiva]|nr:hypothetical protein F5Y10DRAFT_284198 [Nemania abortiva]